MFPELEGKSAIVTGGGKGIGKAIASAMARQGARVIISSRTESDLAETADMIRNEGGTVSYKVTDLSVSKEIEELAGFAITTYGGIDLLINNAARSFLRPLLDIREDGFDKIFDVNVKATFLLSREAAKSMMQRGGGRIVNITTVGAERGGPMMGIYYASKAAIKMLSMCMAVEWAPLNILVNCVGPGLTKTDFSRPIWSNPEMERQLTARIPQGRLADPEDIVGAVLFLCSDNAKFINGQTIYVDGGALANF